MYSLICRHNLKPDSEILRGMINLHVKMKDVIPCSNFVLFSLLAILRAQI